MKRIPIISLLLFLVSCNPQLPVSTISASDSTSFVHMDMEIQLPDEGPVRDTLLDLLYNQFSTFGIYEQQHSFPRNGVDDPAEYMHLALHYLDSLARIDYKDILSYYPDGEAPDFIPWTFSLTLKKTADTLGYALFDSFSTVYTGGAHGGITGSGNLVIDKHSGEILRQVIDPNSIDQIQPLLRSGLIRYFAECGEQVTDEQLDGYLLLDGRIVPLPAWEPSPTPDGLLFTYQQYEIAPYAAGMPSFIIPYSEIAPFVTPKAKKLFAL